jgi:hypothetical protein
MGALLGSIVTEACHLGTDRGPNRADGTGAHQQAIDDGFELVDLTHVLAPSSPYIEVPNATFPFRRTPIATIATRQVYANRWELAPTSTRPATSPSMRAVWRLCPSGIF